MATKTENKTSLDRSVESCANLVNIIRNRLSVTEWKPPLVVLKTSPYDDPGHLRVVLVASLYSRLDFKVEEVRRDALDKPTWHHVGEFSLDREATASLELPMVPKNLHTLLEMVFLKVLEHEFLVAYGPQPPQGIGK